MLGLHELPNQRKRKTSRAQVAECILLAIGFVCVGWFVYALVDRQVSHSYESYKLDSQLRGEKPSLIGYVQRMASFSSDEPGNRPVPAAPEQGVRPPMARGSLIGRLEIPRIKVSAVVREGSDDKTLKKAAGHIPSTALPGEFGNVGVAAHRDSFFRNLRDVRQGDTIRMVTTWGTYQYKVHSLKIVKPENVEVLKPESDPLITLVTCYPFNYVGSAPKRFIVQAKQIGGPETEAIVPASSEQPARKSKSRKS